MFGVSIEKSLGEMKKIQKNLLDFLDDEENTDENFEKLQKLLFDQAKIIEFPKELKLFFHLLIKISNNHHRNPNFYTKIENILQLFKEEIKNYSNSEIIDLFKSNKRILLYLIEEKLITVDSYFVKTIIKKKYFLKNYPQYFTREIEPFKNEKWFPTDKLKEKMTNELPENFDELRKSGEHDNFLCKLIQNDSIIEFITYINKNSISHNAIIRPSIYETNSYLIKKEKITLIEYALFYGSIQIFNFLKNKINNDLNKSLWIYSIHGRNPELIHLLEENFASKDMNSIYKMCYFESIKCHHNEIANYFLNNFLSNDEVNQSNVVLKNYNFSFIQKDVINQHSFCYLCFYDYYSFVDFLLKNGEADINTMLNKGKEKKSALFLTIEKENIEMIKLLLSNDKIDVNIINNIEKVNTSNFDNDSVSVIIYETALHLAIEKENIEIIKLLLNNDKIDVNLLYSEPNFFGEETALYLAIEKENVEIVELLLQNDKIDVNIPFKYDSDDLKTPLYLAVEKENIDIVKLLLNNDKIDVNFINKTDVQEYIKKKDNVFNRNVSDCERTALYLAIEKENVEIVKLLLNNNTIDVNTINCIDNIIFLEKIGWGEEEECVNSEEKTALYLAIEKENIEIIELLLNNNKIDVNTINNFSKQNKGNLKNEEKTTLYLAIEKENIEIIKLLLNNSKINVNISNNIDEQNKEICKSEIKTALYLAIEKENIDIIKLLLNNDKIDVNVLNNFGEQNKEIGKSEIKTSLYLAIEKENIEIIKLLLNNDKIDVNVLNNFGEQNKGICKIDVKTALYLAIEKENIEIIKLLLNNDKIDVNVINSFDKQKRTALHLAVKKGIIDIIDILMSHKDININAEDEQGRKPIDYTTNDEIKRLFNNFS